MTKERSCKGGHKRSELVVISFKMMREVEKELKQEAKRRDLTISQILRGAVLKFLKESGKR